MGNVFAVILLFYFVFAVVGMCLFGTIRVDPTAGSGGLNRRNNFSDFPSALLVLLQLTSTDAWQEVLEARG